METKSSIEKCNHSITLQKNTEERFYITPEDYVVAEKNGLTKKDVYRRVYELNWSIEKAIKEPKIVMKPRIEYSKKEKALMVKNNLTPTLVTKRINSGWKRKAAVSTPKGVRRISKYKRKRRKYTEDVIKTAKSNGIEVGTFYMRVRRGWTIESASTVK